MHVFKAGFSPNVICHYEPADPDPARQHAVIVSAHYDSRGSFGSTRAPGGNDDGSGSGHLLAIARAIAKGKIAFHSRVTLAWFAGEEQGLYGSHAYAAKLRESKTEVALQIQADMLGYHAVSCAGQHSAEIDRHSLESHCSLLYLNRECFREPR